MPTLRWRLGNWRTIRGPRLSKECFGGRIDERHLTRRLRGALRIIHESIGVMLASELPTSGSNLIGARAKRHAEDLVGGTAACHRERPSPAEISPDVVLRSVIRFAINDIETKCSPLPYDEGERRRRHAQSTEGN
jgi:hypothetical protein